MTDQLYLSIWLDRNARPNRRRHFEKLLRIFPFSQRDQGQNTVSIQAVSATEPPLFERPMNGPVEVEEVLEALRDYNGDDLGLRVETWWDLWLYTDNWALAPARVSLSCLGPEFDNGATYESGDQEDLRIEFGVDIHYLPQPDVPGGTRLVESNIKSLLRLVHELDSALPVARRRLETESGENFADRLKEVLTGGQVN